MIYRQQRTHISYFQWILYCIVLYYVDIILYVYTYSISNLLELFSAVDTEILCFSFSTENKKYVCHACHYKICSDKRDTFNAITGW